MTAANRGPTDPGATAEVTGVDGSSKPTGVAGAAVGQIVSFLLASLVVVAAFYDSKTKDLKTGLLPVLVQFPLLWFGLVATIVIVARRRAETIRELTVFRVVPKDALYMLVGVGLQFVGGAVYSLFGKADDAGQSAEDLINNARNNTPGFFVLAAFVGIGAPLVEEMFYRGLVAKGFERLFTNRFKSVGSVFTPLRLGVIVSALWFAAIHLQPLQFPLLFAVGASCAWLTLQRKRLGPAIFVHVGFNLTTVIALGLELLKN